MPIYEYLCGGCAEPFEELVPLGGGDVSCPACGATQVTRLLSQFSAGRSSEALAAAPARSGGCCGGGCGCCH
jgi:putative FmdB family regulatory protein